MNVKNRAFNILNLSTWQVDKLSFDRGLDIKIKITGKACLNFIKNIKFWVKKRAQNDLQKPPEPEIIARIHPL